jgi:hypothetical protein
MYTGQFDLLTILAQPNKELTSKTIANIPYVQALSRIGPHLRG